MISAPVSHASQLIKDVILSFSPFDFVYSRDTATVKFTTEVVFPPELIVLSSASLARLPSKIVRFILVFISKNISISSKKVDTLNTILYLCGARCQDAGAKHFSTTNPSLFLLLDPTKTKILSIKI